MLTVGKVLLLAKQT